MKLFMKSEDGTDCALYCGSGCNDGVIFKVDFDGSVDISLVSDIHYIAQKGTLQRLKDKWKRIKNIILNKEYSYFDICVLPGDVHQLKEFITEVSNMPPRSCLGCKDLAYNSDGSAECINQKGCVPETRVEYKSSMEGVCTNK